MKKMVDDGFLSVDGWEERLRRAEYLSAQGMACAICGGTGGWPGLGRFVVCIPCNRTGVTCEAAEGDTAVPTTPN